MDTQKLIQYLKQVRSLESLIYTQNLIIAKLMAEVRLLGIEKQIKEKRFAAEGIIDQHGGKHLYCWVPIGVMFLSAVPISYFVWKNEYSYLLGVLLCVLLLVMSMVILKLINESSRKKQQKRLDIEYSTRVDKAVQKEHERMRQELAVRRTILDQIKMVQAERDKAQVVLRELYSVNAIAEKYRGLVPVTMICEYLELGRCYGLHGHEGAYNLYENERRLDKIITQLEDIKRKLDQIRDNQYALYEIMSDANNTLARIERGNSNMLRSMKSIEKNAELIEFNTRSTATIARATGEFLIVKEFLK